MDFIFIFIFFATSAVCSSHSSPLNPFQQNVGSQSSPAFVTGVADACLFENRRNRLFARQWDKKRTKKKEERKKRKGKKTRQRVSVGSIQVSPSEVVMNKSKLHLH